MNSGHRLCELIAHGPLPAERLLTVGTALADRLAAAHATADSVGALTTSTVFVSDQGATIILDAGRMPISGGRDADLFATGVLLYTMATGKPPYGPPGRDGEPTSPAEINPRLPSGLVQLIRRSVHTDAERRFGSAAELRDALGEVRRAPGSLESLLPSEHVSSSAAVKPPPRPIDEERQRLSELEENAPGLPFEDTSE